MKELDMKLILILVAHLLFVGSMYGSISQNVNSIDKRLENIEKVFFVPSYTK